MDVIDLTGPNDVWMRLDNESDATDSTIVRSHLVQDGPEPTQADNGSGRRVWFKLVIGLTHFEASAVQVVQVFNEYCKKFAFQKEQSEDGFLHYQCLIALYRKARKQQVINELSVRLGCTVDNLSVRGSDKDFISYVTKRETRVDGPWSKGFPGIPSAPPKIIKESMFYPWQKKVWEIIKAEPDDRSIYWIWDPIGNCGKTAFCKFLIYHRDAFVFRGKSSDMASRIVQLETDVKIAVMNVSRTQESFVSYQGIEEIKDGLVCSGKYEGGQKIFDPPHVFIFANFEPDRNALSMDRWKIMRIDGHDLHSDTLTYVPGFNIVDLR